MEHDPLCPWEGSGEWEVVSSLGWCDECVQIAGVRADEARDMLAKCIAAVESVPHVTDERWLPHAPITVTEYRRHAIAALHNLEQK